METKKVDVERGWGWIQDGWALFMKNPGMWVLVVLIWGLGMALLMYVPFLGVLASGLLGTMLSGGVIYGAAKLDGGGALEITHPFQAFLDSTRTGPMLILGCIAAVGFLLSAVLSMGLVIGSGYPVHLGANALLGVLLVLLVNAVLTVLLVYAIPLVMLEDHMEPFAAVKESLMGCLRNWQPLLVFGLILMVLSFLAALPLGLGFLILGPVSAGAWYQSYKEIYGG